MESLDTSKDKIKKICEILKNETLRPAQEQAQQILEIAQDEARQIVKNAELEAHEIKSEAKKEIQKEKEIFENALLSACKQGVESLRQQIEKKLFNENLSEWVEKQMQDPELGTKLITALISAIEKEGFSADFSAIIPKSMPAEKINALLSKETLDKLNEKAVVIGDFNGGIQLKLRDRKMTLDLSDNAIKELIARYIQKDFRRLLFQE